MSERADRLKGNPHYEAIAEMSREGVDLAEDSALQVGATLALAYEQRTANMIAYQQSLAQMWMVQAYVAVNKGDFGADDQVLEFDNEIKRRLGVGDDT